MKQILNNNTTRLAIISLLSLVTFLFFSAAFSAMEAFISNIQQSFEHGNSVTYHHIIN